MTKLIIASIAFFLLISVVFGQQTQSVEDPFYYEVSGLVYVREYDATTMKKTLTQKIPKEPLRFKIVSRNNDALPADTATYYAIQIFRINPKSDVILTKIKNHYIRKDSFQTIIDLKNNTTYINSADNDKYYWIGKVELDKYVANGYIKKSYLIPNVKPTYGANLSLPFKLRPETAGQNIKITPDLTLGGYFGAKWRLSHTDPFYLSFPVVTLGLATLSINDENNPSTPTKGDGTVLGITGSWGGVFQFKDFQFGLIMGWDRAAGEIGKDWIYNNKPWYSFSIGYSFLGNNPDKDKKK